MAELSNIVTTYKRTSQILMVAFAPSNIPASIGTVEELLVWASSILTEVAGNDTVQTDRNTLEPVSTCQTFRFADELTDRERVVIAAYVPLNPNWRGAGRFWEGGINELSSSTIPPSYTS